MQAEDRTQLNWTARLRHEVLKLLTICLLATAVGQIAPEPASALTSQSFEVPAGFGAALEQSSQLKFGSRVSSNVGSVAYGAMALAAQPAGCVPRTLVEVKQGPVGAIGEPLLPFRPGFRYDVTVCDATVSKLTQVQDCPPAYSEPHPTIPNWFVTITPPCTWKWKTTTDTETHFLSVDHASGDPTNPRGHVARGFEDWVNAAVDNALDATTPDGLKARDAINEVYWNSSPGYNSRQVVGLNTWLAASADNPQGGDWEEGDPIPTHGRFFGMEGNEIVLTGAGGPNDEIRIEMIFEQPRSIWQFENGVTVECDTPGQLWTQAKANELENLITDVSDSGTTGLCMRAWERSSAHSENDIDLVVLDWVQIKYDWTITSPNAQRALDSSRMETEGEHGSKKQGESRKFAVGEVQTYGVVDASVPRDAPPEASPWVGPKEGLCDRIGGFFGWFGGLIAAACSLIGSFIQLHLTVFKVLYDAAVIVATVVKVVFTAIWDLIKGCLGMIGDLVSGVGDIAVAIKDFVIDPSGQSQEILSALDQIAGQLSNPDTALDFALNVLGELAFEALALHHIAQVNDDGSWSMLDDPNWTEWTGRVICEVVAAVLTAGQSKWKDILKSTEIARRIRLWLNRLPDIPIKPCTIKRIVGGVETVTEVYDYWTVASTVASRTQNPNGTFNITNASITESNSFLTGTPVRMADGTLRPIELIEPGDAVLSWDTYDEAWEAATVVHQWSAIDDGQLATATLADGSTITATDGHRFWVHSTQTWTPLEQITAGDLLLTPHGPTAVTHVTEQPPADNLVWELSVADNNNFTVHTGTTDLLVHNAGSCSGSNSNSSNGGNGDFRNDADGSLVYDDGVNPPIDNVAVDADGFPVVIATDNFTIITHTDGTFTLIDKDGVPHHGLTRNPDGSLTSPDGKTTINADGSFLVVNPDGGAVAVSPGGVEFDVPADMLPATCNSFPAGTHVGLADGTSKTIESLSVGDAVISYDEASNRWDTQNVQAVWSALDQGLMTTVSLSDGSQVTATDHHEFFVASSGEWEDLVDVQPGDTLLSTAGPVEVADSTSVQAETVVWDISVSTNHNFVVQVGGHWVLVHNCGNFEFDSNGDLVTSGKNEHGLDFNATMNSAGVMTMTEKVPNPKNSDPPGSPTTINIKTVRNPGPPVTTTTTRGSGTMKSVDDGTTTTVSGRNGNQMVYDTETGVPADWSNSTADKTGRDGNPPSPLDAHSLRPYVPGEGTYGVVEVNGMPVHLHSGSPGPSYGTDVSKQPPGLTDSNSHVEGHAVAIMIANNLPEMDLTINYPTGPCNRCQRIDPESQADIGQIAALLPPESVLTVHYPNPDGSTSSVEIVGTGN